MDLAIYSLEQLQAAADKLELAADVNRQARVAVDAALAAKRAIVKSELTPEVAVVLGTVLPTRP